MADPTTSNIALTVPTRGSDPGTWDTPINSNTSALDGYFGGVQIISLASTNINLTAPPGAITPGGGPTQSQNAVLRFTGTLSANVFVGLPLPGYYIIENLLTITAFTLVLSTGHGENIGIPYGVVTHVYSDGTNVKFVNLPQIGAFQDYAGSVVPNWLSFCTKPPFLNCDGSSFNGTTYPVLAAILGGTTLPDLRGVSRRTLNQGTGRLTVAGSGLDGNTNLSIKTTQSYSLLLTNLPPITPTGTITVTNGAITISPSNVLNPTAGGGLLSGGGVSGAGFTPTATQAPSSATFTGGVGGGSNTPFGIIGPSTVAGITLIRAG
jgi:hypothetical protein